MKLPVVRGVELFLRNIKLFWGSILVVSTVLIIFTVFSSVLYSISDYISRLSPPTEIRAYLKYGETNPSTLMSKLTAFKEVDTIKFIDRHTVYSLATKEYNSFGKLRDVSESYFPSLVAVQVKPMYRDVETLTDLSKKITELPEVEYASYGGEFIEQVKSSAERIRGGIIFVNILLFFCAIFVIYMMVNISLFRFKSEIEVYSIVGASLNFISGAYILATFIVVSISYLISIAVYAIIIVSLQNKVKLFAGNELLTVPDWYYYVGIFIIVALSSAVACFASVKRFVHSI